LLREQTSIPATAGPSPLGPGPWTDVRAGRSSATRCPIPIQADPNQPAGHPASLGDLELTVGVITSFPFSRIVDWPTNAALWAKKWAVGLLFHIEQNVLIQNRTPTCAGIRFSFRRPPGPILPESLPKARRCILNFNLARTHPSPPFANLGVSAARLALCDNHRTTPNRKAMTHGPSFPRRD